MKVDPYAEADRRSARPGVFNLSEAHNSLENPLANEPATREKPGTILISDSLVHAPVHRYDMTFIFSA